MIGRRGMMKGAAGMVWTAGDARSPQGPQAREAARPDRRMLGTSRAGVGPAPSQGQFIGRLVVVFGTGGSGVFVYSPTPAAGNLIASIASSAGTDPYGNAYVKGIASYSGPTSVNAELLGSSLIFNETSVNAAAVIGSNSSTSLILSSGRVAVADTESILSLNPGLAGAVATAFLQSSAMELQEVSTPVADGGVVSGPKLFGDTTGHASYIADTRNGDGVAYRTGENTYFNGSAVPIPASGFQSVTAGQNVESGGTYLFEGIFRLKQGAAGSIPGNVGFTMPAVSFGVWYAAWQLQGALNTFNSQNAVSLPTQINVLGAQTVANDEVWGWYKGIAVFSASGNFQFGCQADGTHPFTAQPGCIFTVRRVA